MLRLIAARIGSVILTLLLISLVVFIGADLLPGDAADALLGQAATPEAAAALRGALHLNEPAPVRYLHWLAGLLTGNPGMSIVNHVPIAQMIVPRLGNSVLLGALTALIALPCSVVLGILAAVYRGSLYDRAATVASIAAVSVPDFLIATVAVILFAVELRWFPAISSVRLSSLTGLIEGFTLPVLTLSLGVGAQMMRMTRAALIGVIDSSYIEMARLKGLSQARIVLHHALPNAAGPIANAAGSCSAVSSSSR